MVANGDSLGWQIEGMMFDLDFERGQLAWAKQMMRDFPLSKNHAYYRWIIADAELRIMQLQNKFNTFSCAPK